MTDVPTRDDIAQLYRAEAIESYQRGRTDEGHLLEIEPRWTRWAYRLLLAVLAAALVYSALVHVDRYADGYGIVRDGRLVAVVPARDRAQLRPGQPLQFEHASQPLTVTSVQSTIIAGKDGEPVVRIEATAPRDVGNGVRGRVRVRVSRERLLTLWVPHD